MKIISLILAFGLAVVITGCNTMEGVGEDMEAAGDAIENSAEDGKNY